MKVRLMHRDRDFDLEQDLPWNERALAQDLELDILFRAMSNKDEHLLDVARRAVLSGLQCDVDTILYRQEILKDCLKNPALVRGLYDLAVEAIESKRKSWYGYYSSYPGAILGGSIEVLRMFVDRLRKLRELAREQAGRFASEGWTALFAMLGKELTDEYLASVQHHLTALKLRKGVLLSAQLGEGGDGGAGYVLHQPPENGPNWLKRILGMGPPAYSFRLHERDEAGARILSELRTRGINLVANALAQSADHVLSFFEALRTELAFYVGCLNLRDRLAAKGEPLCFPAPEPGVTRAHRFNGLYDVCLTLHMEPRVVGNAVNAEGKSLAIITGPNQGGKSSFLRSIGVAQMMMQCGMFVAAESFAAEVRGGLFTHYVREEDATMKSGKLDEELGRMNDIVEHIVPNSMLLFNESFAATNEREGSEIARQIVCALLEKGMKIFFVTHLYDFAHGFLGRETGDTIFLRAERKTDGTRTFRLLEGDPLDTSHGEDLYTRIFAAGTEATDVRAPEDPERRSLLASR